MPSQFSSSASRGRAVEPLLSVSGSTRQSRFNSSDKESFMKKLLALSAALFVLAPVAIAVLCQAAMMFA
jgi:preprotein translocase subunit SecG